MNKRIIGIVGKSGTGKSTSIETLDPKSTYIINVLGKALPFKGSEKLYNTTNKNIADISSYDQIITVLKKISDDRPDIKTVVIEDAGYIMFIEEFRRANETGYSKFSDMANHMYQIMTTAKHCREDLNIVFVFHENLEVKDGYGLIREIKLGGKMIKEKFSPEENLTMILYTKVEYDPVAKQSKYSFITNTTDIYPAKSPKGMFDTFEIPNDINYVINKANEYYS